MGRREEMGGEGERKWEGKERGNGRGRREEMGGEGERK